MERRAGAFYAGGAMQRRTTTARYATGVNAPVAGAPRRPNILLIMSDEHAPHFASPYGHPIVRSPNLDRLAAAGVTLDACYCPSPLCVPSRAAFMTGKHLHRVRAYDNGSPFPSDEATWAHMLRAADYEVALDGKMHFVGPDSLHGFERQLTRDSTSRIAGSEWLDPFPRGFRDGATTRRWVEEAGPGKRNNLIFDDEVEEAALTFLREKAGTTISVGRPWALCVSFLAPHFPLVVPEPYFSMYYPDNVDLPVIPPGTSSRSIRRTSAAGWRTTSTTTPRSRSVAAARPTTGS